MNENCPSNTSLTIKLTIFDEDQFRSIGPESFKVFLEVDGGNNRCGSDYGHGDIGSDEMGLSVNWPMEGTNHESYHS